MTQTTEASPPTQTVSVSGAEGTTLLTTLRHECAWGVNALCRHPWWTVFAVLIVVVGTLLRAWGLDFGLPNESRPDELSNSLVMINNLLVPLSQGDWTLNPHRFHYPSVYFYVGLVMYAHLWLWGLLVGSWTHMAQLLESYWNDPTPFYLALRWLSVVCGVATIGVVAALGKTLSGNRTAWLAAGLMATNYLAIRNSHFGTIDSLWTLAISVALWTMLHWAKHLPERPVLLTESLATSPKPYAVPKWVLAAVGVAIGVKYPAAVLLVPVWWIACTPLITPSLIHWGALFKTIGQISLVVLGVFLLTSPWTVLDMHQFLADVAYESSYYYTYRLRGIDPGWLFYPKLALWHGVGAGLLACAAWGVWQTRKSIPKLMHVVLLGFGLAYFVLCLGPNVRVMTRYALPLIPVVLVYAALGIEGLAQWFGTRLQWTSGRQQSVVAGVLASILMLPSLSSAVAMDRLLSQLDTRTLARNWILAHVSPEQPIAAGPRYGSLQLPLAYSKLYSDPMREPSPVNIEPWLHHDHLVTTYQYPKMFDDLGIRLVVLFGGMPMFSNTPGEWRSLNQVGKLVAQWVPVVPNLQNPAEAPRPPVFDPMDAMYLPFVNFDAFERPGPQVAIVAVPQTPVSKANPKSAALAVFGRR